jgi:hypothetical protein
LSRICSLSDSQEGKSQDTGGHPRSKRCCWRFTDRFLIAFQMHLTETKDLGLISHRGLVGWLELRGLGGCTKFQDVLMASEVDQDLRGRELMSTSTAQSLSLSPALLTFQNRSPRAHRHWRRPAVYCCGESDYYKRSALRIDPSVRIIVKVRFRITAVTVEFCGG